VAPLVGSTIIRGEAQTWQATQVLDQKVRNELLVVVVVFSRRGRTDE
jgi:hypothetical protein